MDREKYPICVVSTHEDEVETLYKLQNPFGRTAGRISDNSGIRVDGRPTFKDESPSCIEWAAGVLGGCGCLKFDTTLEKVALSATVSLEKVYILLKLQSIFGGDIIAISKENRACMPEENSTHR
jgi:hypothetical protein